MPIYEYKCLDCGAQNEKMQKISDEPLTVCQVCGGKLEKQWSLSGFQFKGAGWYVTDYSGKLKDPNAEKSEKSEKPEKTETTEKTEKSEKSEKTEKTEKIEKTEKTSTSESTTKPETASNKSNDTAASSKTNTVLKKDYSKKD